MLPNTIFKRHEYFIAHYYLTSKLNVLLVINKVKYLTICMIKTYLRQIDFILG